MTGLSFKGRACWSKSLVAILWGGRDLYSVLPAASLYFLGKDNLMATKAKAKRSSPRRAWTKGDQRELKTHSKAKTPVAAISKKMKRTVGALRQQALKLGISLGHRR
jgi:hypothetical protein